MIQKSKKTPGRPRAFDKNEALGKAAEVFWRQGYDGSSLDDLQNAMGIGRPSLYHAFGDKRSLFLQCLDYYGHNIVGKCVEKLQTEDNIREALAAFLIQSAKNVSESSLGCMVGCVATSVNDPDIRQVLQVSSQQMQEIMEQRLRRAIQQGQLAVDFPVEERARRAFDMLIALGYRGRSGAARDQLIEDAKAAARLLLSHL